MSMKETAQVFGDCVYYRDFLLDLLEKDENIHVHMHKVVECFEECYLKSDSFTTFMVGELPARQVVAENAVFENNARVYVETAFDNVTGERKPHQFAKLKQKCVEKLNLLCYELDETLCILENDMMRSVEDNKNSLYSASLESVHEKGEKILLVFARIITVLKGKSDGNVYRGTKGDWSLQPTIAYPYVGEYLFPGDELKPTKPFGFKIYKAFKPHQWTLEMTF